MISAKKLVKLLKKRWYELKRIKWSHYHFYYEWKILTIPFHNWKDIWRWLLRKILKQANFDHEEFLKDLWVNN